MQTQLLLASCAAGTVSQIVDQASNVNAHGSAFNHLSGQSQQIYNNFKGINTTINFSQLIKCNAKERQEFANWLSPINFHHVQSDIHGKMQEGTGEWVFDNEEFNAWIDSQSGTLWCAGIPGVGKTFLASHVINYLMEKNNWGEKFALAFIYCNYQERHTHTADNLLANILKQLVLSSDNVFRRLKDELKSNFDTQSYPNPHKIHEILTLVIKMFPKVFIVVDALDEVTEDHNNRIELLHKLQSLGANLLVTSRDMESIGQAMHGVRRMDIYASEDDQRKLIGGYLRPGTNLYRLVGGDDKRNVALRNELYTNLSKNSGGMFLLCRMNLNLLERKNTRSSLSKALNDLPKDVGGAYAEIMNRIMNLPEDDRNIALWTIVWVVFSWRPLKSRELEYILAFSLSRLNKDAKDDVLDGNEIDDGNLVDPSKTISLCNGLIVLDKEESVFHLVHCTAQQYFDHFDGLPPNPNEQLTRICLRILSSPSLINSADGSFHTDLGAYALQNWGNHARGPAEETLKATIHGFFACEQKVQVALRHIRTECGAKYASGGSALHLCAFFDLARTIKYYRHNIGSLGHWNGKPLFVVSRGRRYPITALFLAVGKGHADAVKYLLEIPDQAINSKNIGDRTPLSEVVRLLLTTDNIAVNARDSFGRTSLENTARYAYIRIAKLLLERRDIDVANTSGETLLYYAAKHGHIDIVKLLLERNCIDINPPSTWQGTPLSAAAAQGHTDIVSLLLERPDLNVNLADIHGETPLHYAAGCGQFKVVELLLAKDGIDVNSSGALCGTPLSSAVCRGHASIVGFLLQRKDIDVNRANSSGETPLHHAAGGGHIDIIRLLLAKNGIDINLAGAWCGTPLSSAASQGHATVINLLLQRGDVDVNRTSDFGRTPLHHAAERGHTEIVRLLLAKDGIDINSSDGWDGTPLSRAARMGHADIVALLLERQEIDVNLDNGTGDTPLHYAVDRGSTKVVELLLRREDIRVNSKYNGWTPLSRAACRGHADIVELLLEVQDIDVSMANPPGKTLLYRAAENGHTKVVELLMQRIGGIGINSVYRGCTPHMAVIQKLQAASLHLTNSAHDERQNWTQEEVYPPIWMAARQGDALAVQSILGVDGVDVNAIPAHCKIPPLWAAAFCGDEGPDITAYIAKDTSRIHLMEYNDVDEDGSDPDSEDAAVDDDDVDENASDTVDHESFMPEAVIDLLLQHPDTNVNWRDNHNRTLLLIAAKYGLEDLAERLLKRNDIDVNGEDENGDSPLHHAARSGHIRIVSLILHHDCTVVNLTNAGGQTPLHHATANMQTAIVALLLTHKDACINLEDNSGLTPLELARSTGAAAIVSLFEQYITVSDQNPLESSRRLGAWCLDGPTSSYGISDATSKIDGDKPETPRLEGRRPEKAIAECEMLEEIHMKRGRQYLSDVEEQRREGGNRKRRRLYRREETPEGKATVNH